jgi:hypothetical protein
MKRLPKISLAIHKISCQDEALNMTLAELRTGLKLGMDHQEIDTHTQALLSTSEIKLPGEKTTIEIGFPYFQSGIPKKIYKQNNENAAYVQNSSDIETIELFSYVKFNAGSMYIATQRLSGLSHWGFVGGFIQHGLKNSKPSFQLQNSGNGIQDAIDTEAVLCGYDVSYTHTIDEADKQYKKIQKKGEYSITKKTHEKVTTNTINMISDELRTLNLDNELDLDNCEIQLHVKGGIFVKKQKIPISHESFYKDVTEEVYNNTQEIDSEKLRELCLSSIDEIIKLNEMNNEY